MDKFPGNGCMARDAWQNSGDLCVHAKLHRPRMIKYDWELGSTEKQMRVRTYRANLSTQTGTSVAEQGATKNSNSNVIRMLADTLGR